jgi:hypothetical protein
LCRRKMKIVEDFSRHLSELMRPEGELIPKMGHKQDTSKLDQHYCILFLDWPVCDWSYRICRETERI